MGLGQLRSGRCVMNSADKRHKKANRNKIVLKGFSSPESDRMYTDQWPREPKCRKQYDQGLQCGGCSFYAQFDQDLGLCCHKKSRHFTETVFEHFTCPQFVLEGWGPHSFSEDPDEHCWCQGGRTGLHAERLPPGVS